MLYRKIICHIHKIDILNNIISHTSLSYYLFMSFQHFPSVFKIISGLSSYTDPISSITPLEMNLKLPSTIFIFDF